MVAPHFHTTQEVKEAIHKVGHDGGHDSGPPVGIGGGSSGVITTSTDEVVNTGMQKGADWADIRKSKKKTNLNLPHSHAK